eukprot:TRINITY_DN60501_c0_g1_i1.p2 TRINITY_DN60501_c0_g1~~TRINITY_DN60501_c0_g1_i1.p2  ORF type:complete len:138 (-),score=15.44 TRINITY_DN60501_c0_g1_i1:225-638(-)
MTDLVVKAALNGRKVNIDDVPKIVQVILDHVEANPGDMAMPQACVKFSASFQTKLYDHTTGDTAAKVKLEGEKDTLAVEKAELEKKANWAVALRSANPVDQALLLSQAADDWEIVTLGSLDAVRKLATKVTAAAQGI